MLSLLEHQLYRFGKLEHMPELPMIPFYCGGLIAKDSEQTVSQVPVLGDLPLLGNLFRSKSETGLKREVIIVITPSVLPEETPVHAGMPKDEDTFDKFGHRLFRDAYRIRAEDTFDLRYLTENQV